MTIIAEMPTTERVYYNFEIDASYDDFKRQGIKGTIEIGEYDDIAEYKFGKRFYIRVKLNTERDLMLFNLHYPQWLQIDGAFIDRGQSSEISQG